MRSHRRLLLAVAVASSMGVTPALVQTAAHASGRSPVRAAAVASADDTPVRLTPKGEHEDGSDEQGFDKLRDAYYWSRLLSGDDKLTIGEAAALREKATTQADAVAGVAPTDSKIGSGTWTQVGPDPLVQVVRTSNTFAAMSGRVSALAIRDDGTLILGAAQGGVWTYDETAK